MNPHKSSSLNGHKSIISCIHYLNSRNQLLSASDDGEMRLWNIEKLSSLQVLKEHKRRVCIIVDVPDSQIFITGFFKR
jgi:WD40 repeat protein